MAANVIGGLWMRTEPEGFSINLKRINLCLLPFLILALASGWRFFLEVALVIVTQNLLWASQKRRPPSP